MNAFVVTITTSKKAAHLGGFFISRESLWRPESEISHAIIWR
jgi:hypothetical protein